MKDALLKADPAAFEIVKNSLYKIAEEMRVVLAKTAYSPILKSAGDYSCGVFDARGEMVAQGPDLPIHLGSMPDAVRAVVGAFGDDVHDGDVFIHNDPYFGGSHLPDVNVVRPAFHDGRLLGYACLRAHWPDVGSATIASAQIMTGVLLACVLVTCVPLRRCRCCSPHTRTSSTSGRTVRPYRDSW